MPNPRYGTVAADNLRATAYLPSTAMKNTTELPCSIPRCLAASVIWPGPPSSTCVLKLLQWGPAALHSPLNADRDGWLATLLPELTTLLSTPPVIMSNLNNVTQSSSSSLLPEKQRVNGWVNRWMWMHSNKRTAHTNTYTHGTASTRQLRGFSLSQHYCCY